MDGWTALMLAARQHQSEVVQTLVKVDGIDPNIQRPADGCTALMYAAETSSEWTIDRMLEAGGIDVDINLMNKGGRTALMIAAWTGHSGVVSALLRYESTKADLKAQDGKTALMLAASIGGDAQAVSVICVKASQPGVNMQDQEGSTALVIAAQRSSIEAIINFREHCEGVDANLPRKDGKTALMLAAEQGSYEVVDELLKFPDIDINAQDEDRMDALMFATKKDYNKVVDRLMSEADVDITLQNKAGVTALVLAADNSPDSVVAMFGNDTTVIDHTEEMESTLFLAAEQGRVEAVEHLLKLDNIVSVRTENQDREDVLMRAVAKGQLRTAKFLVKTYSCDFEHQNKAKWTLLHHAVKATQEMVDFVLDQWSSRNMISLVNSTTEANWTALQYAVEKESIVMVQSLLKANAAVRHDLQGESSPLRLALQKGYYMITKMLLDGGAAVSEDIDPADYEGKRLAVWFGVELSMMDLVGYYGSTFSDPWAKLWQPPSSCIGALEDKCNGELLAHAKTKSMVHFLMDWQRHSNELHSGNQKEKEKKKKEKNEVRDSALSEVLHAGHVESALALLARGVGEQFEDKLFEEDPESCKHPETKRLYDKSKVWNRLHWCAYSCDAVALTLAMGKSFDDLMRWLVVKGPENETPFKVAEGTKKICPGVYFALNRLEDLLGTLESRARTAVFSAGLTGVICYGSLIINVVLLRLKTMRNSGICFVSIIPTIFSMAGLVIVCFSTGDSRTGQALIGVGFAAVMAGGALWLVMLKACRSDSFAEWLTLLKRKGNSKLDRCWEKLDCTLSWLQLFVLFLQALMSSSFGIALLAGVLHAIACTLTLCLASPRRFTLVLRLVPGACWLAICACKFLQSGSSSLEKPPAEASLLLSTCLAMAWADTRGICSLVTRAVTKVVEIEMARKEATGKFTANKLIFGRAEIAAYGIEDALGLTGEQIAEGLKNPIEAMRQEVERFGDRDDVENFKYIVDGTSGKAADYPSAVIAALEAGVYHGGYFGPNDFDTDHGGRTLSDWMQVDEVKLAKLTEAEFVAVRFYTSSSFTKISRPLRDKAQAILDGVVSPEVEHHPWAMVVYLLDKGIKKLRSVQAQVDATSFAKETILWRGMKNVEVDIQKFREHGGTEMAPMSTTTNEEVAFVYATSKVPLVFKYIVGGMKTGVSIRFLSLYPKEEEFLYAPLTYLTLKGQYEDDGTTILVVEPVMS